MNRPFPRFIFLFLLAFASTAFAKNSVRVSLVFDDGPVPTQTEKMLALLAAEKVHVNFSYVGKNVDAHPELAAAAFKAGHELNNHTYTHPHLTTLDDAAVLAEITKGSDAILHATGTPPPWLWAPFLETDSRVDRLVTRTGSLLFPYKKYHFISTDDWDVAHTDAPTIYKRATTGIVDRTVILFHEWRPETYQELPTILAELRRQGCVFMTFTELAQSK